VSGEGRGWRPSGLHWETLSVPEGSGDGRDDNLGRKTGGMDGGGNEEGDREEGSDGVNEGEWRE